MHHMTSNPPILAGTEFFQRFPPLHGFLLQQLREATASIALGAAAGPAVAPNSVHPGLYPVLILLSRLQPGTGGADVGAGGALSPGAFIAYVQLCASRSPLMAVRQLAARALGPLIVPGDGGYGAVSSNSIDRASSFLPDAHAGEHTVPSMLENLLKLLIEPTEKGGAASIGGNARQGLLFQVEALLGLAPRHGAAAAAASLHVFASHLQRLAECCGPSSQTSVGGGGMYSFGYIVAPASTAAAFFRASSAALSLSLVSGKPFLPLIHEVISDACKRAIVSTQAGAVTQLNPTNSTDWGDPMRSIMLKEATRLWTGPLLLSASSGLLNSVENGSITDTSTPAAAPNAMAGVASELERRFAFCLASPSYDVRAAAVKVLDRLLEAILTEVSFYSTSPSDEEATHGRPPPDAAAGLQQLPQQVAPRSTNTPSRPSGLEEASALLLPETTTAAAAAGGGGSGVAAALVFARALLSGDNSSPAGGLQGGSALDRSATQTSPLRHLCSHLLSLIWSHLVESREAVLKVKGRCLRVLSKLQSLETALGGVMKLLASDGSEDDRLHRLGATRKLLEEARGVEPKAAALQCLGRAVARACTWGQRGAGIAPQASLEAVEERIGGAFLAELLEFVANVRRAAAPDQPEGSRAAAVDALASSGVLLWVPTAEGGLGRSPGLQSACLDSWLVVLRLLEDEDADVRLRVAALAEVSMVGSVSNGRHFQGSGGAGSPPPPEGASLDLGGDVMVGDGVNSPGKRFVEVVLRRVVGFIATEFGKGGSGGGGGGRAALQKLVVDLEEPIPDLLLPSSVRVSP